MSRTQRFWLEEPKERLVNRLRAFPAANGWMVDGLDENGGAMVAGFNGWTWGRIIEFDLFTEGGGTTVTAQWKPRHVPQLITWGQENRDLGWFRRLLTSSAGH